MKFLYIILAISLCSCIFHVLAALCALYFRFFKQEKKYDKENFPKVSCLKPLYGFDSELSENLESHLVQDYPDYEVILGTNTQDDKAYSAALHLLENQKNARLVFGTKGYGANRKVRNQRNIYDHVSPQAEILVLSDSDIRVTRDYLSIITRPIRQEESVGAVTCLYKVGKTKTLAALLEALSIESSFAPGVFVASSFAPLNCAFGATIVLRRKDFIQAGGFEKIENFLADDNRIGNIIHKLGKKVTLSSYVVQNMVSCQKVKDALVHLLRWNRTIKVCQPVGYFFSIITHSTIWSLAALFALGLNARGYAWFTSVCILRITTACLISFSLGSYYGMLRAFLTPLWDGISSCLWLAGLLGRDVVWQKVRYSITSEGEMEEIVKN